MPARYGYDDDNDGNSHDEDIDNDNDGNSHDEDVISTHFTTT